MEQTLPDPPTDQQLMTRLQGGDLDALGTLYERHRDPIYRAVVAITRDQLAAEDILQDCFLRLHRFARNYDTRRPFQPWLYRMAINLAYSWITRVSRWESTQEGSLEWLPGPEEAHPERRAEISDLRERVLEAISALSTQQSSAIVLYYLKSRTLKEVAHLLDCPVGTVKSRLYYARENIHQLIATGMPAALEVQHAVS